MVGGGLLCLVMQVTTSCLSCRTLSWPPTPRPPATTVTLLGGTCTVSLALGLASASWEAKLVLVT